MGEGEKKMNKKDPSSITFRGVLLTLPRRVLSQSKPSPPNHKRPTSLQVPKFQMLEPAIHVLFPVSSIPLPCVQRPLSSSGALLCPVQYTNDNP